METNEPTNDYQFIVALRPGARFDSYALQSRLTALLNEFVDQGTVTIFAISMDTGEVTS